MNNDLPDVDRRNELRIPNQVLGIFLVSVLGLFLETLFIRWVGTEVRIFAYLQNTILVVCFLGIGLGAFTASEPIEMKKSLLPLFIFLLLMAIPSVRTTLGLTSEMLSVLGDLVIWFNLSVGDLGTRIMYLAAGLALTFFLLILIVDIFVPIGRILGRLMNSSPTPIWAYSINIFGSIIGTWAFVLCSYLYLPPFVWFLVAGGLLLVFVVWLDKDRSLNLGMLGGILVLSWFAGRTPNALDVIWSPYQKLVVHESDDSDFGQYLINVNNVGYQAIIDLSAEHVLANPGIFPSKINGLSQYDLPLLFHPAPQSFLVVGAGSGNDVAGALRHDVDKVVAVEIDPAIITIGTELHPEEPYTSPHVVMVNDDARSYLATTNEKFDVISFGLLDSHTTTALTNARLDHYVYTRESLVQAKSKLNEGGIIALTFDAQRPFIIDRIERVLRDVFGRPPLMFYIPHDSYGWGGVMFVTGDTENIEVQLAGNERLAEYIQNLQADTPLHLPGTTRVATDDWPYLYLESSKIPALYYLLTGLMALIAIRSSKKWRAQINISYTNRSFWHFFFLGSAFLLLEVQNISKASVVLGNTWQVNAVIISSILFMALIANWIASKFPTIPVGPVYVMLIGSSIALYFIDLANFGFLPYFVKAIIVGSLTSLPMLFSGIVFVRSFAVAEEKSSALGANLIGALVGALLQSVTFVTGIKALLLIVAGFYLLSLLTAPKPLAMNPWKTK